MSMSRNNFNVNRNNYGSTYQVSAVLNLGRRVELIGGLRALADGRYLERQIKLAMNITPGPVGGECWDQGRCIASV